MIMDMFPDQIEQHQTAQEKAFETFWQAYPRKVGKRAAWLKWKQLRPPLEHCLSTIKYMRKSRDWQKDNGQFIPHPATWLHQGRWEDRPEESKVVRTGKALARYGLREEPISLEEQAQLAAELARLKQQMRVNYDY